ncbi:DNA repair protein RecN [Ruminococcaceae bacterium OttesenSCG-928-I18]|nr:DNA repair protein RecN [Ruminococcaceae bacterium OttesenSCG-928-I18]
MLSEITIENVAVIEKASVAFGPGFTVLTGETGAGKSIMIDSINAILGGRTSKDLVRSGAQKACLWARFSSLSAPLRESLCRLGYETEEELLLYREISSDGKGQCRVNGSPATASILKEIGAALIQVHGQHDNHSLTNPAKHLPLLDLYAGHGPLLQEYYSMYNNLVLLQKEKDDLSLNEAEKARKIDLLQYEVDEIQNAQLSAGEEEELLERRNVARNQKALLEALFAARQALAGTEDLEGAVALLGQASQQVDAAADIAAGTLAPLADTLRDTLYNAREWEGEIGQSIEEYSQEADSLDEIEARLDILYRLKQKYGSTLEEVLSYGQRAEEELQRIETSQERVEQLSAEIETQHKAVQALADKLTKEREKAFEQFFKEIRDSLAALNMPGARMELRRKTVPLGPTGQDEIEFLFSANPGETPKPMAKIASGGELARVMLAFKNTLARRDEMPTVIYDEIDTGISGQAAGKIGRMLKDTAGDRQVICVTHTAQIAAFADEHLYIEKMVEKGRTFTKIHRLDEKGRVGELARIVSGDKVTSAALANAQEMLSLARQPGQNS